MRFLLWRFRRRAFCRKRFCRRKFAVRRFIAKRGFVMGEGVVVKVLSYGGFFVKGFCRRGFAVWGLRKNLSYGFCCWGFVAERLF